jgi:alkylation response protein AidB-like acyl-CoA dehydrogenase
MANTLINKRDQQFILYEQLDLENLFTTDKFADYSRDMVDMMLNEAEKMALEVLLPTYDKGDKEGCVLRDGKVFAPPSFHEAYRKFCEAGWLNCMRSVESGGQGMPHVVSSACFEHFNAANFPLIMYPGLTNGAGGLIDRFGTAEQKKKYMERMYTGEWSGTMCLTEPGAGSDVGALKTSAKRLPDGRYSITGTKLFISSGDHDLTSNIIHTVLARIEGDPAGTKGISIFIVPKYRVNDDGTIGGQNDVITGSIEHKMGIKGSATCLLVFGENGNCVGELIGQEQEGIKIMFHLMNEARIEVGMQGLGAATAAYQSALAYSKERLQGSEVWELKDPDAPRVPIIHHPDIRRSLLWMKAHVEGIRALIYYTAYCQDMATAAKSKEERDKWSGFSEILVPVCKAYSTEKAFQVCSKAIDVYGGYGYCSEYPVEQYLRDCKITTIYEGTNGIQALDLVGRKISLKKGAYMQGLSDEIRLIINQLREIDEMQFHYNYLDDAKSALNDLTVYFFKMAKSSQFLIPILNAQPYLDVFGDVAIGAFLLQAAGIAAKKLEIIYQESGVKGSRAKQRSLVHDRPDVSFYTGKIAAAKFFATNILSTVRARCEAIKIGEKIAVEIAEESFSAQ